MEAGCAPRQPRLDCLCGKLSVPCGPGQRNDTAVELRNYRDDNEERLAVDHPPASFEVFLASSLEITTGERGEELEMSYLTSLPLASEFLRSRCWNMNSGTAWKLYHHQGPRSSRMYHANEANCWSSKAANVTCENLTWARSRLSLFPRMYPECCSTKEDGDRRERSVLFHGRKSNSREDSSTCSQMSGRTVWWRTSGGCGAGTCRRQHFAFRPRRWCQTSDNKDSEFEIASCESRRSIT